MALRSIMAGALALALGSIGAAQAQQARVMIPAGAGGGWDGTGRGAMNAMQQAGIFTDGVQYTNKGGAAGTIGLAEFASTQKGQDNAIMIMGAIMVGGIALNKSPVTLDQVTPIARLTNEYNTIAVPANSPLKSVADFVAALKANPGAVAIAGGSAGGVDHIAVALIAKAIGVEVSKINYVPTQSGAEVVAGVVGGKYAAGVSGISELKPQADTGRMRLIAVTSEKRVADLPNVPTLMESGVAVAIGNWRGVVGAPGMSAAGVKTWTDRFDRMAKSAPWQETLKKQGWDDAYLSGPAFASFLKAENERMTAALKDVGLLK